MTTKKKYIQHNKQCYACGQEKAASFLGYDIKTLKTYCIGNCKKKKDIPAVELVPATNEDLVSGIVSNYSKDDEDAIMSLLGKVASTRLRPAHILHIMKIAEMEGMPSIQATLLNVIEADMETRNMDHVELESFGQDREPEEEDEMVKDETVEPYLQTFAPEPVSKEGLEIEEHAFYEAALEHQERTKERFPAIKATINDKPVEPVKEVEEDNDNPFEI